MKDIKRIITEYIYDFIGNSIYDMIKFLLSLLTTNLIGIGIINRILVFFLTNIYICIITSIIMMILFTSLFLIVYRRVRKYKFQIKKMKINFEYKEDKIIIISKIDVKALRKGLDKIYNGYTWYPDERTRLSCLNKEFSIKRLPKKDLRNEYYIQFNRILKKGEIVSYTTKVVNENKKGHFLNFYSREIIAPIKELIITVVIPSQYGFKHLSKQIIKGSAYNDFVINERIEFYNTYTWNISDPKIGYEYKLLWEK